MSVSVEVYCFLAIGLVVYVLHGEAKPNLKYREFLAYADEDGDSRIK